MESLERIKEFIEIKSGAGDGYGSGSGTGTGTGDWDGYGYGSGSGTGSGTGDGDGYGYGSGSGTGSGTGDWYGYGYGSGYGNGYGDGYGYGSGYGTGDGAGDGAGDLFNIILNGNRVYNIDKIPTVIKTAKGNFATGYITNEDLTLTPCYVVKSESCFAHGKTLKEAYAALQKKLLKNMPVEERIDKFLKQFKLGVNYSNKIFFEWHHILTGSCLFGRQQFCKNKDIDLDGEMSVEEFIELTKNNYGGNIILALEKRMQEEAQNE